MQGAKVGRSGVLPFIEAVCGVGSRLNGVLTSHSSNRRTI